MILFKVSRYFLILAALVLSMQDFGVANVIGTPKTQKGAIVVNGNVLNFEKGDKQLIVRDKKGETVFQWKSENDCTLLKDFDYSVKNKDFVVLLEIYNPEKKVYSLKCQGPNFIEIVQNDVQTQFGGAVFFEIENNETKEIQQWVVFLTNRDILSYYSFAKKRLMAKEKYPTPVLGIAKSAIDSKYFLILKQLEKGKVIRQYKREFAGPNPARNPLLPMD